MFLAPGKNAEEIANVFGYCLAYAAERHGIQIHACVAMSNHYHADLTDPLGELPAFKQLFHSLVARSLNALRGRDDSFWSSDPACDTRRATDDETLMDLVYTLTNPVSAGLVKWSRDWPGFTTMGWRFNETRTFQRPTDSCFDEDGKMPKSVSLTLVRPPVFLDLDDERLDQELQCAIRRREREAQTEIGRQNRRFMGLVKLRKVDWTRVARSFEAWFTVAPKVAGSSKQMRWRELTRDRLWEQAYVNARELLRAGLEAVFPAGTYWLRRFAGARVAAAQS